MHLARRSTLAHLRSTASPRPRAGLRGWLLVYMIGLVLMALHGLSLTVAAVVIYANPALAGLTSFVPLGSLVVYVASNVVLVGYTTVLVILMVRRRRAAVANNIVFHVLSVLFVLWWHVLGEKSLVGTVVDSLFGLVGIAYILRSKRVRATFVNSRSPDACTAVVAHHS